MDFVNVTEIPCFVYTYHVQVFTRQQESQRRSSPPSSDESTDHEEGIMVLDTAAGRLYKALEDAERGAKHLLANYNRIRPSSNPIIYITKTLSVWDADTKHVTLLEAPYQLNCNMNTQMIIPDTARGYPLGGQKTPVLILSNEAAPN